MKDGDKTEPASISFTVQQKEKLKLETTDTKPISPPYLDGLTIRLSDGVCLHYESGLPRVRLSYRGDWVTVPLDSFKLLVETLNENGVI